MGLVGGAAALGLMSACTGTGGDTGPTWAHTVAGAAVEVEDARRPDGLRAAALEVRFGVLFQEELETAGTLGDRDVNVDGTFVLGLPEAPEAEAIRPLSNVYEETLLGALYLPIVYEDDDGDGLFTAGTDRIAGADMDRWLIYLDQAETPGDPAQSEGWPLGWSLVDLRLSGQYEPNRCRYDSTEPLFHMTVFDEQAEFHELTSGLEVPLAGLTASLTLGGEVGIFAEGVVALPYQLLAEGEDLDKVFDTPVQANAYVGTVSEPPPDSHYVNGDPDWSYTYAIPVPYTEVTADGEYTVADDLQNATVCVDGEQVYLRYTRPVRTYRGYRFLECYGATAGWRLATTDPASGAPLFWTAEQSLEADLDQEACPLW